MDPKNTEKPFHDSAVNELERSVSLCTLCEFENKYLYTDTQVYGLSLPLLEQSSTSDDFSSPIFTPERRSLNDHLTTVAVEDEQSPIYKSTKDPKTKKKSPIINDDDISSSFLDFVQKTAKQVPDRLSQARWDDVSWDKSDEKREDENSQAEAAMWTEKNFADAEITKNGIESFISDIDDFLNEDEDKRKISGETSARQVAPPRSFVSDITDEIPTKRSKVCATARRLIDTPHPTKFSERFMNLDKSTNQERSKIFAEDFRISSVIISRERKSKDGPLKDGAESLNTTQSVGTAEILDEKSKIIANKLCRSPVESGPELGEEPEVPKSDEIHREVGEKSVVNVDEEIYRQSVKQLPEVEEETYRLSVKQLPGVHEVEKEICRSSVKLLPEVEEDIFRPSVKQSPEVEEEICRSSVKQLAEVEEEIEKVLPMRPKIISADHFVVPPLRVPLKPRAGNDRDESDDTRMIDQLYLPKTNVPTNQAISQTDENHDGEKLPKRMAETEELPGRNKRNRKSNWPEKSEMMDIGCCPDYTKMEEDKLEDQSKEAENLITDGVPKSQQEASRKKQNRSDPLKPEDKEKLTKSWKEVKKDFASKDKRPRYPPLALRNSPPPPDLKIIMARAAKRKQVLADAIDRLNRLNSYMGEVRSIFRNDNKQYSIVKPSRSSNGRMKILVSTSTQTSDGEEHPADSSVVPPSTLVEAAAEKQREEPDIKNGGLFCYNLLHTQPDMKDEQAVAETLSRSAQNDKSAACAVTSGSDTDRQNTRNIQNTLQQPPTIVEKPSNLDNRPEIKHDMHTYNPLRAQKEPKRLRKTALNKKPTAASCKPLFLNRLL